MLASEQGSLGILTVTNIRVVWHSVAIETFNVSIPYLQIANIEIRTSQIGEILVVTSTNTCGKYVLGFKIGHDKLHEVYQDVKTRWDTFGHVMGPLGVQIEAESAPEVVHTVIPIDEADNIIRETAKDAFAAYYEEDYWEDTDRPVIYSPELGLAIEKPRNDCTLAELWEVTV